MEARSGARWAAAKGHEAAGGRVKHLRGDEDLRHASLQDFREET